MDSFSQCLLPVLVLLQIVSRISSVNLPSGMSQGMYCEGCIATVTELSAKVNKPSLDSREVHIVEALEKICDYQNFATYEYSPPKTAQACSYLMELFETKKEEFFVYLQDSKKFVLQVCFNISQLCDEWDKEELDMLMADPLGRLKDANMTSPEATSLDPQNPETQIHIDYQDERTKIKLQTELQEVSEKDSGGKSELSVANDGNVNSQQKMLKITVEKSKLFEIVPDSIDSAEDILEDDFEEDFDGEDDILGDEDENESFIDSEEGNPDKELNIHIRVPVVPAINGEVDSDENQQNRRTEL